MSKKNSILIISIVSILIIGGLIFFYITSKNGSSVSNNNSSTTNPFGNTSEYNNSYNSENQQNEQNNTENSETVINTSKLTQIYKNPTSGAVFFNNKENKPVLRFVDRAVGNIYEYKTVESSLNRVTNTTIPKIQESIWSNTGNNLVLRYLDNDTDKIISFVAKIENNLSTSTDNIFSKISGNFLTPNVNQVTINPKGDKIFSLIEKSDRSGTFGFTTNIDGGNKKNIFDSSISYWNISWPKNNIITFTTKPNSADVGLLYFFNTDTYEMTRVLGNILGLSTLTNKDTDLVAYSYSVNNIFSLNIYDVKNKINKNMQISTLADKCVWGNTNTKILYCAVPQSITIGNYPDVWYQGLVSFSDDIWQINTEDGTMKSIYQIGENESTIDAYNLNISSDDKYISFTNKNDLSLWLLQTTE